MLIVIPSLIILLVLSLIVFVINKNRHKDTGRDVRGKSTTRDENLYNRESSEELQ